MVSNNNKWLVDLRNDSPCKDVLPKNRVAGTEIADWRENKLMSFQAAIVEG